MFIWRGLKFILTFMAYPPIYSSLQQDNLLCNHKPEEDKLLEDIFDDIFNEADALNSVDAGSTRTLSNLVRQLRNLDAEVATIEENLKGLRQERAEADAGTDPRIDGRDGRGAA
jgi:chromosome segregation ATPase